MSAREHLEVSEDERQYDDGADPRVGDIMDVPLLNHQPWEYQHENWLLDPQFYWRKVRKASWAELVQLHEPGPLWSNGQSTYHGENDKIPFPDAVKLQSSLQLVRVDSVLLLVFAPGEAFGNSKRRVQARFSHEGTGYALWVTDPEYETRFKAKPDGRYPLGECLLTISLAEPFQGDCYKVVAAVIERGTQVAP